MLTAAYIAIGAAFARLLSIPHRKGRCEPAPEWAWLIVAALWPVLLPYVVVMIVRRAWQAIKEGQ